MPKRIEDAKIALLNCPLEIEKTEMSAEISISDAQQMQSFLDEENRMLKSMVDKVAAARANVLICQKGIDHIAQHYLAKGGILAARRAKESDMNNLAMATGGRVITNIDDVIAASKPKESGVPKPGAGGMPCGADMGTCMKLEILSIPLSIFLYEPNFACKKSHDESFVMKGIDLPLA
jgi:chaperonin GroEL (HSP60 family)